MEMTSYNHPFNTPEVLLKARAKIRNKNNWCRGVYYKARGDGGLSYCAVGAIYSTENEYNKKSLCISSRAVIILNNAAHEMYQMGASDVNDEKGHSAVMKVYKKAIEIAEQEAKSVEVSEAAKIISQGNS